MIPSYTSKGGLVENIKVVANNSELFDELVHNSAPQGGPEGGDLTIVSKASAIAGGKPAVVVSFTAVVDGKPVRVQAVTTLALLVQSARILGLAPPVVVEGWEQSSATGSEYLVFTKGTRQLLVGRYSGVVSLIDASRKPSVQIASWKILVTEDAVMVRTALALVTTFEAGA